MKTKTKIPKPSSELIAYAKKVFACMAYVKTIQPIVEGYQREILKKHQFHISEEFAELWKSRNNETDHIVLDPNETYILEDVDFQVYLDEVREQHLNHGFNVPVECCPLLIAQNNERKAKLELFDLSWELVRNAIDKETFDKIPFHPDNYKKYIDLTLKFLVSFVK